MKKLNLSYVWVAGLGVTFIVALFMNYNWSLRDAKAIERDNHPLETKQYIDEQIAIQQKIYAKADLAMQKARDVETTLISIRAEKLEVEWLQVKEEVKTIVLEDVLEVPVVEWRYIPWWKVIPSWITWNTKAKRFHNFVAHFAREFDSSVFVEARNRYWVKEEVLACIARADSDMWNANKSSNNIMNYGNNDRWQTRGYDNVLSSVMAAAHWMSEWKYLSKNNTIWELSGWGRLYLWLPWCSTSGVYCYATSEENRRRNVNNCLTFIEWEAKDRDSLPFKK